VRSQEVVGNERGAGMVTGYLSMIRLAGSWGVGTRCWQTVDWQPAPRTIASLVTMGKSFMGADGRCDSLSVEYIDAVTLRPRETTSTGVPQLHGKSNLDILSLWLVLTQGVTGHHVTDLSGSTSSLFSGLTSLLTQILSPGDRKNTLGVRRG